MGPLRHLSDRRHHILEIQPQPGIFYSDGAGPGAGGVYRSCRGADAERLGGAQNGSSPADKPAASVQHRAVLFFPGAGDFKSMGDFADRGDRRPGWPGVLAAGSRAATSAANARQSLASGGKIKRANALVPSFTAAVSGGADHPHRSAGLTPLIPGYFFYRGAVRPVLRPASNRRR
ncbi:hypothetical protein D1872_244690 [compost metagenome]